ncbi:MAG: DNA translocase FtsK [Brevinematia bacterium]
MLRRTIGGISIFALFTVLIVYKFYPSILIIDNPISFASRKIIYILRILGGENNVEIMLIMLILTFLPLLFKKPLYYFFKNLLGIEFIAVGFFGIIGLQNLEKPAYTTGLLPYDISHLSSSILGEITSYIVFILTLVLGTLLFLTSYKTSTKILKIISSSITLIIQKTYDLMNSWNNPIYENRNYTKNSYNFSTERETKKSTESRRKFIEITEIDLDESFETKLKESEVQNKPKYQEEEELIPPNVIPYQNDIPKEYQEKENYNGDFEIKDVEIVETYKTENVEREFKKEPEITFDVKFHGKYPPPIDLLDIPEERFSTNSEEKEIEDTKKVIQNTFEEFKIDAIIEGVVRGPVVTMYEVRPKPGTKIAKIVNISDNLALNLATSRVRIVYPIPGKSVIGIEIPNKIRRTVKIREIIESREYQENRAKLPLTLGIDIHGKPIIEDLTQMPHLLIAGSTGSGKSVYINSIIAGLLYKKKPDELKFIMIDLKIVELKVYNGIPHLLSPVITTPNLAKAVLEWLVEEMQSRYKKLESFGCRDIVQYNSKIAKLNDEKQEKLPYIVLIIDEYADLMMTSPRETEDYITRLAAMSRAVGIHLIIATQRPSVDVVTGLIKANFPARVAFRVASKVDSRTILDTIGAEKLLGKGDLLFMSPSYPSLMRIQGCYISNEEVERIVDYLIRQDSPIYTDLSSILEAKNELNNELYDFEDDEFSDELYNEAIRIVITEKKASASYLQRRLRIGYNRAARMIEKMEEEGIVGPQQGSKPREILVDESYLEKLN